MLTKQLIQLIFILILCVIFTITCAGKKITNSDSEDTVDNPDPFEQNKRIGRGINLGNALEAPKEGDWGVVLRQEYFKLIKDAGFQSVRIPIRWSNHAQVDSPYTINPAFFNRVDWAIIQARNNGLAAIINIHHYEEIMENPAAHKKRYLGLWRQIANRYKDEPLDLFFEILNEPNNQLSPALWNEYLVDGLQVIRESNAQRTVIIGTANWGGLGSLAELQVPEDDPYLIVTFHYYNPFQFTHQGAEWVSGSEAWLGSTWTGTTSQKQAVTNDFNQALAWASQNNRPLFMGEFGAYSKAAMDSRVRWTEFVRNEAEKRGFSWAYWEFCSGFGAYDLNQNSWRTELLQALIHPESP
jgi:endoglucanase